MIHIIALCSNCKSMIAEPNKKKGLFSTFPSLLPPLTDIITPYVIHNYTSQMTLK